MAHARRKRRTLERTGSNSPQISDLLYCISDNQSGSEPPFSSSRLWERDFRKFLVVACILRPPPYVSYALKLSLQLIWVCPALIQETVVTVCLKFLAKWKNCFNFTLILILSLPRKTIPGLITVLVHKLWKLQSKGVVRFNGQCIIMISWRRLICIGFSIYI